MTKLNFVLILCCFLAGCIDDPQDHTKSETPETEEGTVWGDGVVSENPPGLTDEDTDGNNDSGEDVTEEEEEDPAITYEDCSGRVGDHPCNFEFLDQNGDTWNLWEHTGTVMVVDFSTIWCGVCNSIAGDAQPYQDTYTDLGYDFLWVTVLVDGPTWGTPPIESEIQKWVSSYGMTTSPVLLGDRTVIDTTAASGIPIVSWPTLIIVDQDMRIAFGIGGWSESMITSELESVLGL